MQKLFPERERCATQGKGALTRSRVARAALSQVRERDLDIRNEGNPGDSSLRARNDRVGPARSFSYGVVSSFTLQEMAPFGPGAWVHVHRHSLISGIGGPFSLSARNFPLPVGAPTRSVAPLAVGSGTLHDAQAFASHLLPIGAFGLYWPNT